MKTSICLSLVMLPMLMFGAAGVPTVNPTIGGNSGGASIQGFANPGGSADVILNMSSSVGPSNSIVLGPGDYYPTLPTTLQSGQKLIGIGRPRIHWDVLAHTGRTTNEACIGIAADNITIEGIDFIQTNKTQVPSVLIGAALFNGAPGFTNLLVRNCRLYGKNDCFYFPTTNYMQGTLKDCYLESQWDFFAMNGSNCTNDWLFDSCDYVSLDSTIAGDNSAFKNVWNAANVFKGTNVWRNCRFHDYAAVSDTAYQTWIYPPAILDGALELWSCKFDNGQQLFASQAIANKFTYRGDVPSLTFDFQPTIVPTPWVREIFAGQAQSVLILTSARFFPLVGSIATLSTTPTPVSILLPTDGYYSNFTVWAQTGPANTTNFTFRVVTNTANSPISCVMNGVTGVFTTNDVVNSFAFSSGITNPRTNLAAVSITASTAPPASSYAWSLEWWHKAP